MNGEAHLDQLNRFFVEFDHSQIDSLIEPTFQTGKWLELPVKDFMALYLGNFYVVPVINQFHLILVQLDFGLISCDPAFNILDT